MADFEIPLKPQAQTLSVKFPNGNTYTLRLLYQFNADDCWELDIGDANGDPIVCGIPLVTGCDLLAQYAYLGFGCSLFVTTDGDRDATPKWFNLGVTSHLWLETPQAA